jgi:hypothetical protein
MMIDENNQARGSLMDGARARSARTRRTFFSVRIPRAAAATRASSVAALQATPHSTLASLSCSLPLFPPPLPLPLHHHPPPPPPPSHASALAITSATAPLADSPLRVPPPPPSLRRASILRYCRSLPHFPSSKQLRARRD